MVVTMTDALNLEQTGYAEGHEGHGECGENLAYFAVQAILNPGSVTPAEVLEALLRGMYLDAGETLTVALEAVVRDIQ